MGSVSAAADFEAAFLAAAIDAIGDPDVLVVSGYPYPQDAYDIVSVGQVTAEQEPASLGARRRNETLTLTLLVSVWRPSVGQEADIEVRARARALLGAVEYACRVTDTTVGGTVIWCFMTDHQLWSDPFTIDSTEGRTCEVAATFQAFQQVVG